MKTYYSIKLRVVGNRAWSEDNREFTLLDSVDRSEIKENQINYFEYIKTSGPRTIAELKNGMVRRKYK